MLRARLSEALKTALKAKDDRTVSAVRLIVSAMKDRDIAARPARMDGITDDEILGMLQGMIKQRNESIALYRQGNRLDLVATEQAEIDVIQTFLPAQMDDAAIAAAARAAITEVGAAGVKDMGKVMAALKAKFAGQMDFGKASATVKGLLA